MKAILQELEKMPKLQEIEQEIKGKKGPLVLSGLTDVGKILSILSIQQNTKRPICLVTYNEMQARKLVEDLQSFAVDAFLFPKKEIVTYDYLAESKELPYERIEKLCKIQENKYDIVVTSLETVKQKMVAKDTLFQNALSFHVGNNMALELIKKQLVELGYERCEMIDGRGKFSVRGGILDIAVSQEEGIRVEFWGDEIDSIRKFQIETQRSTKMLQDIVIYPAHEYILERPIEIVIEEIKKSEQWKRLPEEKQKEDIEQILQGDYIAKIDKYFDSFYQNQESFLDYLSEDTILFVDENTKIQAREENIENDIEQIQRDLIERKRSMPEALLSMYHYQDLLEKRKQNIIYLESQDFGSRLKAQRYHFNQRELHYYKSSLEAFIEDIRQAEEKKKTVFLVADQESKRIQAKQLLEDRGIHSVFLVEGTLSSGLEDYEASLFIACINELFEGEKKKRKKTSKTFQESERIIFDDLKIGDYVVHRTHGIGQYIGVNTIKADGITKDYIKIRYKGDDILYIPTNQLDNIRKYVGGGEAAPKINRLGSKEWEHTKEKVKKNLREVARELIELYAKRQKMRGHAFSKDTPWQKEFEEQFPYQETDDQLRCIREVKQDMEADKPMDRLLCGDVGYGKTEVAIRAAFKAVMDQKQVAYLVPTTILADQQYQEFKERMEHFPIRVELLNRFRTKKEQEAIIKKLKLGEIDVIIGTHRILSKDVTFKDLGLLIIDEEHRFGVKDKEKIKEYKTNVDVLAMTATPIPRTLHMSIVGIRDMSVIYEPPQDRKPVQTYVLEYDKEVIREAITKELERKGQVFYLYNKVETIEKKANEIMALVPEAKVSYAHGKMTGNEIEDIMEEFIQGKTNVLVCTTILESGIDIPNANTMIVENADRLGLAQLYQIRGRVGRSNKQAYAYITYRSNRLLSEVADKRLKAMKEFTEFGSGFKIAMRDLEIRGAGSLLGEIQHGHMEQVGYDTYCHLLNEVMQEMKGIEIREEPDVQIDLNVSSYIPDDYISSPSQKIEIYQNIALCRTEDDIKNTIDELIDRFGDMPEELENLIEIARLKALCKEKGIMKIVQKVSGIVFTFDSNEFHAENVDKMLTKWKNKIKFSPGSQPYVTYKIQTNDEKEILKEIKHFLEEWE